MVYLTTRGSYFDAEWGFFCFMCQLCSLSNLETGIQSWWNLWESYFGLLAWKSINWNELFISE